MNTIGIIGGSGLYAIDGLKVLHKKTLSTPFGKPSGTFVVCSYAGARVVFLPRHGKGHVLLPNEVNYRANIFGMKMLGVERIISVAAVGSLKEMMRPGDIVIVDQFIDRTNQARKMTFFGEGIVAHISFAQPVCGSLAALLYDASRALGVRTHRRGTYINMEGPAFSTKAESLLYRSWGVDVIGMTNMAEARLAREAGICYATMALVTDYDCWRTPKETVTVEMILDTMHRNVENAKKIIKKTLQTMPRARGCSCKEALRCAIVTDPRAIPQKTKKKLRPIIKDFIR
jgi:5'-methylthioadenosine phosphorylase